MHLRQIKHSKPSKPRPRKVPWSAAASITVSCWLEESSRFRVLSKRYLETPDQWLHRNSVSLAIPVGETRAFGATAEVTRGLIVEQAAPASTDLDRIITWRSDKD